MNSDTSKFVGTWRLLSVESKAAEGQTLQTWGKNVTGRLISGPDGRMAVQLMKYGGPASPQRTSGPEPMPKCGTVVQSRPKGGRPFKGTPPTTDHTRCIRPGEKSYITSRLPCTRTGTGPNRCATTASTMTTSP